MLSSSTARLPKDMNRIDVADALELQWWSIHFSVTPEVLRAAVEEHGPSAEEIRAKLKQVAKIALSKGGED